MGNKLREDLKDPMLYLGIIGTVLGAIALFTFDVDWTIAGPFMILIVGGLLMLAKDDDKSGDSGDPQD